MIECEGFINLTISFNESKIMCMDGLRIENVVASSSMGAKIDLIDVSKALDGSEYDRDKFPGLVFRSKSPKTSLLLFSSGKVVCTGGKTSDDAKKGVEKLKTLLNENGVETSDEIDVKIQNIVASYKLGQELNLNSVAITLGLERVEYEPEQFPGLVFRSEEHDVVLLLFGSGSVVCTGGKEIQDLEYAVKTIKKELKKVGLLH